MNIKGKHIKCVSNFQAPELVVGKVYTASEVRTNPNGIWQVEVGGKWYAQNRFELVKENEAVKQQFYVGDKVKRVNVFDEMYGGVHGEVYEVTDTRQYDGCNDLVLGGLSVRSACYYNIVERAWQKNIGRQPVKDGVVVQIKRIMQGTPVCYTGRADSYSWHNSDIIGWRLADSVQSTEEQPEDSVPPSHVAVGDELVSVSAALPEQEWTDKHYDNNYTLTQKDIERGFVKIDPYFVSKMWKIGSKDDSGALWHCFKTIARFGEKNSREREIKALYAQIKCLAELENVNLGEE